MPYGKEPRRPRIKKRPEPDKPRIKSVPEPAMPLRAPVSRGVNDWGQERELEDELAAFLATEEGKQLILDAVARHPRYSEEVPRVAKGPPPPKQNPGTPWERGTGRIPELPGEEVPRTSKGNYPHHRIPREKPLGSTGSVRPDRERGTLHMKGSSGGSGVILLLWLGVSLALILALYLIIAF